MHLQTTVSSRARGSSQWKEALRGAGGSGIEEFKTSATLTGTLLFV